MRMFNNTSTSSQAQSISLMLPMPTEITTSITFLHLSLGQVLMPFQPTTMEPKLEEYILVFQQLMTTMLMSLQQI